MIKNKKNAAWPFKRWKAELRPYQAAARHTCVVLKASLINKLKSDDALACYLLTSSGTVKQDSQVEESIVMIP